MHLPLSRPYGVCCLRLFLVINLFAAVLTNEQLIAQETKARVELGTHAGYAFGRETGIPAALIGANATVQVMGPLAAYATYSQPVVRGVRSTWTLAGRALLPKAHAFRLIGTYAGLGLVVSPALGPSTATQSGLVVIGGVSVQRLNWSGFTEV